MPRNGGFRLLADLERRPRIIGRSVA